MYQKLIFWLVVQAVAVIVHFLKESFLFEKVGQAVHTAIRKFKSIERGITHEITYTEVVYSSGLTLRIPVEDGNSFNIFRNHKSYGFHDLYLHGSNTVGYLA
jgi:hypothetical protein